MLLAHMHTFLRRRCHRQASLQYPVHYNIPTICDHFMLHCSTVAPEVQVCQLTPV